MIVLPVASCSRICGSCSLSIVRVLSVVSRSCKESMLSCCPIFVAVLLRNVSISITCF